MASRPDQANGAARFVVPPGAAGLRLDQAIARLAGLSRRQARAWSAAGRVWLNQKPARVLSREVRVADVVDLLPGESACPVPPSLPPALPVLADDGWILAVDKPAGMASQAPRERGPGEWTVQELAAAHLAVRTGLRPDVLLIHRLDRLTTGVFVLARHHEAARALAAAWGTGDVKKLYLALVVGDPGERRVIDAPIDADRIVPGRHRVAAGGRGARSEVWPVARCTDRTLVAVRPLTGRTHQVRVHLAHIGFPVAGDPLYGATQGAHRPFLHAWRLDLPHPRDGRALRLEAPLPADLHALLAAAGMDVEATLASVGDEAVRARLRA